ncbi:MAG: GNAT family N-acetyltransferase [Candidatus Dormibacteria bacterium]
MTHVVVAEATDADVVDVVAAYEWLFEPPGAPPKDWDRERAADAVRRALTSESAAIFVATVDRHIVGLCTAYEDIESVRFGRRVWVEDLAVHPHYRSQGAGKLLLDQAKLWARRRGARRLQLDSSVGRTNAHRFYEREGPDARSLSFAWWL